MIATFSKEAGRQNTVEAEEEVKMTKDDEKDKEKYTVAGEELWEGRRRLYSSETTDVIVLGRS